ncbi:TetR/AcrR family transcriptional regulator [Thermodesulfobacteriota bacterium]
MPPKINFRKEKIIQIAFEILRKEGLGALSARKIAMNLKCSTRPVYTAFRSMTELQDAVIEKARQYAMKYFQQNNDCTGSLFLNMGIQYFRFAREEKELFKLLFLDGKMGMNLEKMGHPFLPLIDQMKKDDRLQDISEESLKRIGLNMWIYTHGLVSLSYNEPSEHAEEFVMEYLMKIGKNMIEWKNDK